MRALVLLFVLPGCLPEGVEQASSGDSAWVEPRLVDPLAAPPYRFCHAVERVPPEAEVWCDLALAQPTGVCPALREACERGQFTQRGGGCLEGVGGSEPTGGIAGAPEAPSAELPELSCDSGPSSSPAWLRYLIALAVAVGVVAVGRALLARASLARGSGASDAPVLPPELDVGDEEVPDLAEEALLHAAEEALAAGRLGQAAVLARGAVLRRLGRSGHLELRRWRTDREYVRRLSAEPDLKEGLLVVVGASEAHRWAGRPLTHEIASEAVAAAGRLLARVVVLMMLMAPAARAADRRGPDGDAAIFELMAAQGYDLDLSLRRLDELTPQHDVVWLDVGAVELDDSELLHLEEWVFDGGLLISLGGVPFSLGWHRVPADGAHVQGGSWSAVGLGSPRWSGGPEASWCAPDAVEIVSATGTRRGCGGLVVATGVGAGGVIGISDARLVSNAAFVSVANRNFVTSLLPHGVQQGLWPLRRRARVVLHLMPVRAGPKDPAAAMRNVRLVPFILHVLLIWLLLAAWRGWPFGTRREPAADGRLDFLEHPLALGRHWQQLDSSRHAASAYARLWLGRLGSEGLAASARRHGYSNDKARRLVSGVAELARRPDGQNTPRDLSIVEELWKTTRHR